MIRAAKACLLACLLSHAVAAGAAPQARVSVEKLDGMVLQGQLRTLTPERLALTQPGGETVIALDEVVEITLANEPQHDVTHSTGVVALADGGRLPFNAFAMQADAADAEIQLPKALVTDRSDEVTLPASTVREIRFSHSGNAHNDEWNRLAESATTTDLIVVYRKQRKAIDGVECTIEAINAEGVQVNLDGEGIIVPSAKVHGVVFAKLEAPATVDTAIVVEASGGFRVIAKSVQITAPDRLLIEATAGPKLTLPLAQVERIDLSAGRVRWLSDLKLVDHSWRPYFGFPSGLPREYRRSGLVFDRAFSGEPLRIVRPERYAHADGERVFARGAAMRSGGEAVFDLPPGFAWFQATAGIAPQTLREGAVVLQVVADDKVAYETTITGAAPVRVRAPLDGASRLRLVVGYGDNLDLGDQLHLGNARVTR